MAIDYGVPLITDVKCAKLIVEALHYLSQNPLTLKTHIDCLTSGRLVRLPGLIDTHVHLRDPGQTHKEDFSTGTASALAGGITLVAAMPNTLPAIHDEKTFNMAQEIASKKAYCDYAIYLGATPENAKTIVNLAPKAAGLKMYLNDTFTTLKMDDKKDWRAHFDNWPQNAPLCVHAEGKDTWDLIMWSLMLVSKLVTTI
jgi:carbamoyl-phosphate synthase/aspartate carbamoyltransferase/dihydroorotase